jgi:hypothetical protein
MLRQMFRTRPEAPPAFPPPLPVDFQGLMSRAGTHTDALMNEHESGWHISKAAHWGVDLAAGEITWYFPRGKNVRAPVQLIGTWTSTDETFLWGWDHPSAPAGSATAAMAVKAHAEKCNLTVLAERKLKCRFDEAWHYAALGVLAGDLQGVYRGQASEKAWAYLGFGRISVNKS